MKSTLGKSTNAGKSWQIRPKMIGNMILIQFDSNEMYRNCPVTKDKVHTLHRSVPAPPYLRMFLLTLQLVEQLVECDEMMYCTLSN